MPSLQQIVIAGVVATLLLPAATVTAQTGVDLVVARKNCMEGRGRIDERALDCQKVMLSVLEKIEQKNITVNPPPINVAPPAVTVTPTPVTVNPTPVTVNVPRSALFVDGQIYEQICTRSSPPSCKELVTQRVTALCQKMGYKSGTAVINFRGEEEGRAVSGDHYHGYICFDP